MRHTRAENCWMKVHCRLATRLRISWSSSPSMRTIQSGRKSRISLSPTYPICIKNRYWNSMPSAWSVPSIQRRMSHVSPKPTGKKPKLRYSPSVLAGSAVSAPLIGSAERSLSANAVGAAGSRWPNRLSKLSVKRHLRDVVERFAEARGEVLGKVAEPHHKFGHLHGVPPFVVLNLPVQVGPLFDGHPLGHPLT